jgi:hypothetical protein
MFFEEKTSLLTRNSVPQCPRPCGAADRIAQIHDPNHVALPDDHRAEREPNEQIWRCIHCGLVWYQSLETVLVRERGRERRRTQVRCRLVGLYDAPMGASPGFHSLAR